MNVKQCALAACFLGLLCGSANADTLTTFTLQNVTFDDGGTATGSFVLDFNTGIITSANITTSDDFVANAPPFGDIGFGANYIVSPPFSTAVFTNNPANFSFDDFFFIGNDALAINLGINLTTADLAINNLFPINSGSEGFSFIIFSGTRLVNGGSLEITDIAATPLPAALPMFMGGVGLIGLLARRRKRKALSA
jgi:hypothetical protein